MKWGKSPAESKDCPEAPGAYAGDGSYVGCDSPASRADCTTPAHGIKTRFHRKGKLVMHTEDVKI